MMDTYRFKTFDVPENKNEEQVENNLNLLHNIDISYNVNVGNGKMPFKDLMNISINDTIPLNRLNGDMFPLTVGDGDDKKVIAYGQIVEDGEQLYFKVRKIIKIAKNLE